MALNQSAPYRDSTTPGAPQPDTLSNRLGDIAKNLAATEMIVDAIVGRVMDVPPQDSRVEANTNTGPIGANALTMMIGSHAQRIQDKLRTLGEFIG